MEKFDHPPVLKADELPQNVPSNALSRREMLRLTGYGTLGLALTALTADRAAGASGSHSSSLANARALSLPPRALTQMQYPFWSGDWSLPQYYRTILLADFDGDGKAELLGRTAGGMVAFQYDPVAQQYRPQFLDPNQNEWRPMPPGPPWVDGAYPTDENNEPIPTPYNTSFAHPRYYETILAADIDKDGKAELLVRWWDGIHVYRWTYNAMKNAWSWIQISSASPPWTDATGWTSPSCYQTIRAGDVDGDGQLELIGRGPEGIEAWKFDPLSQGWGALPLSQTEGFPPIPFSDADGWDAPQKYRTIQLADVDGDGRDELIGRGSGGVFVLKYRGPGDISRNYGWYNDESIWVGDTWDDAAGFNKPQYYETLRAADIDGDGKAELLIRGKRGILAAKLFSTGPSTTPVWRLLPSGPPLSDASGYAKPQYYETIRTADIDGDGKAELLLRGKNGMMAWSYRPSNQSQGEWVQLPTISLSWSDATGWNRQQYYETIRLANIDGAGSGSGTPAAALFALGPAGVEIWKYDSRNIISWRRPSAAYPVFTGGSFTAYQYLSNELTKNTTVTTSNLRGVYAIVEVETLQKWYSADLPNMTPPAGISSADWEAARSQILTELGLVINVYGNFSNVATYYSALQQLKNLVLDSVSELLKADNIESFNAQAAYVAEQTAIATTITATLGAVLAVASVLAAPEDAVLLAAGAGCAGIAGGAITFLGVTQGAIFDSAVYVKTSLLKSMLARSYEDFLGAQAQLQTLVIGDYGLLQVMGDQIAWDARQMNRIMNMAVDAYELWCWQTLAPLLWHGWYIDRKNKGDGLFATYLRDLKYPPEAAWAFRTKYDGFMIFAKAPGDQSIVPQRVSLHRLFDAPDRDLFGVNNGGLGVSVYDVFLRCDGWNLPGNTVLNAATLANELCGGKTTPEMESGTDPVPPTAPPPPGAQMPRIEITAERIARGAEEMVARVAVQNRLGIPISHVEITEALLILPGVGRRVALPLEALPSRRKRLGRGGWAMLDLTFPVPASPGGTRAVLQVRGSYLVRHLNGSWHSSSFEASWHSWPI